MIKTFDQWLEGMDQGPPGGVINNFDQDIQKAIQDAAAKGDYATARQYRDFLMQRQKNLANQQARPPQKPTPQAVAALTPPPEQQSFHQQDPSLDPIGPWRKDYSQIQRDYRGQMNQMAQQKKQGWMGKLRGLFGGG